jgi:hypothetical protein
MHYAEAWEQNVAAVSAEKRVSIKSVACALRVSMSPASRLSPCCSWFGLNSANERLLLALRNIRHEQPIGHSGKSLSGELLMLALVSGGGRQQLSLDRCLSVATPFNKLF